MAKCHPFTFSTIVSILNHLIKPETMVAVGIDLGSTHGCVGVWHNGKVNIIANDQGFRTTPSYVCFEGDETIVGDTAVGKLHSHAESTVFHVKRILGKSHGEAMELASSLEWSFDIVKGKDGGIHATTFKNGEKHTISVLEFVSILIKNLKDLAEDFTGEKVDQVVMSVPPHATEQQKKLVQAAAKEAGLEQVSYISEPLAAAIAYGLDEHGRNSHPEYVLVFDIGGATHDVTLLNADKGLLEIISSSSKDSLGGEDFTKALFEHCAKSFQRKTKLNVKDNKRASNRLKLACEAAKRSLSTQAQANIEVDSLMEGEDFSLKISRPRFEELISDSVKEALKEIEGLLEEAGVEKEHVDHVVLIGGSSRIPLLQNSVSKYFDGKKTHFHISPDEAVAHGATIEASSLAELANYVLPTKSVHEVSVTPLTLSIGLANGSVSELIHRDTILPATAVETFTTFVDNQKSVLLSIYEGERVMAKDNSLLAKLAVKGITDLGKGEVEIQVEFTVDTKGVLSVVAFETASGVKKTLEVRNDQKRLTLADVTNMIKNAEDAADEDDALLDQLEKQFDEAVDLGGNVTPAVAAASGDLD
jgi:L1 cell adhesion molecule like protein